MKQMFRDNSHFPQLTLKNTYTYQYDVSMMVDFKQLNINTKTFRQKI
jgi:hypothetical protein